MQLHLLCPGLLWPAKALYDSARDLELPALSRLLGRGRQRWQEALALEDWHCLSNASAGVSAPAAPLRLLGEGLDPGNSVWMCADPSHFAFEQGRLILGGQSLQIDTEEMDSLLDALQPCLAALPGFIRLCPGAAGSGLAYLQLAAPPALATTPPSAARGLSVHHNLPRGEQARAWTQVINDAQMILHALPLNRRREAAGLPLINTLWLWGAGSLPPAPPAAYSVVLGSDALLRGLARWSSVEVQPLPAAADQLPRRGAILACVDDLAAATQALDANLWRETLLRLEHDWFAPLAAAYFSGRLRRLRLTAFGPESTLDLEFGLGDRYRFWRRARPLTGLLPPGP